jgi:hypothetical protein
MRPCVFKSAITVASPTTIAMRVLGTSLPLVADMPVKSDAARVRRDLNEKRITELT